MFDLKSLAHSLFRPFFGTEEEELDKTEHTKDPAEESIQNHLTQYTHPPVHQGFHLLCFHQVD